MDTRKFRCLLVSDFNPSNFASYLENDGEPPLLDALIGDFGQVVPLLADFSAPPWQHEPDFAVVWTRPEGVIPSFQSLLEFQPVPEQQLLDEVDAFAGTVVRAAQKLKAVFVPTWTLDTSHRGLGMADLRKGNGTRALLEMNLRLAANFDSTANVFPLDAQRWVVFGGRQATSPKLWYEAKIPFGNEVFQTAVADVKAAIRGLRGQARKLIVLDLDDTLWGGIVGEVGWQNLQLGGHDPVGEAFQEFQRTLRNLTRRGIVLGIVSKNTESVALTAIRENPEMVLKLEDFAGWRINWHDKAANLADLVAELNLGLQSVVFIDNSPIERGRVHDDLPEVLVPQWPEDPLFYSTALRSLRCFDSPGISREDAERSQSYAADRGRADLKHQAGSLDEWLKSLGIKVTVESLSPANLRRAAQLLNKTNQLNLSTRRMTEQELDSWAKTPGRGIWVFRVVDRFGDAGLTGLASLEKQGDTAHIVDFLLSCRVIGRKVEEAMVAWLVRQARELGTPEVRAEYRPTPKNPPCLEFWQRSGFECRGSHLFSLRTEAGYPPPECVELIAPDAHD
jgi:FkbH-like protein